MNNETRAFIFWLFLACLSIYLYDTSTPPKSVVMVWVRYFVFILAFSLTILNAYQKTK